MGFTGFEAVDFVVAVLAIALSVILILGAYSVLSRNEKESSPVKEKLMMAILTGVLSAISMFIGARLESDPCCKLLDRKGNVSLVLSDQAVEAVVDEVIQEVKQEVKRGITEGAARGVSKGLKKGLVEQQAEIGDSKN